MEFIIDVRQLQKFARDIKKISPALLADLQVGLTEAGEIVASEARRLAAAGRGSTSGSTRIPGTIKVKRRGVKVKIVAGGRDAPNAGPLNNRGEAGQFRHPVFGNKSNWVSQDAVPFMQPALATMAPAVFERVDKTISNIIERAGF